MMHTVVAPLTYPEASYGISSGLLWSAPEVLSLEILRNKSIMEEMRSGQVNIVHPQSSDSVWATIGYTHEESSNLHVRNLTYSGQLLSLWGWFS